MSGDIFRKGFPELSARRLALLNDEFGAKEMKQFEGRGLWDRIRELFRWSTWGQKDKILHAIAVCKRAAGSGESMSAEQRKELADASQHFLAALRPDVREEMFRNVRVEKFGVVVALPQGIELLLTEGCFGSGEGAITRTDAVELLKAGVGGGRNLAGALADGASDFGYWGAQNIEFLLNVAHGRSGDGFGAEGVNEGRFGDVVPFEHCDDRNCVVDIYSWIAQIYLDAGDSGKGACAYEGAASACMAEERDSKLEVLDKAYGAWTVAAMGYEEQRKWEEAAKAWGRAVSVSETAGLPDRANQVRVMADEAWDKVASSGERNGMRSQAAEVMKRAHASNEQVGMQEETPARQGEALHAHQAATKVDMKNQNAQQERDSETIRKNNNAGATWKKNGDAQLEVKKYREALQSYKRAARMYSLAGNHLGMQKSYEEILGIYKELKDDQKYEKYKEKLTGLTS